MKSIKLTSYPLVVPLGEFGCQLLPQQSVFLVKAKNIQGEPFIVIFDLKAHDALLAHTARSGRKPAKK